MNKEKLVAEYLEDSRLMQVATVDGDKPWICTVYFVCDERKNLYWMSTPERRHSKEIKNHNKVAVAIVVKHDWPIIGLQVEGVAEMITDIDEIESVASKYVAKYGVGKDFVKNYKAGTAQHRLYKVTPKAMVLFDEVNFSGDPRQAIGLSE